jgi:hypothetical protein
VHRCACAGAGVALVFGTIHLDDTCTVLGPVIEATSASVHHGPEEVQTAGTEESLCTLSWREDLKAYLLQYPLEPCQGAGRQVLRSSLVQRH